MTEPELSEPVRWVDDAGIDPALRGDLVLGADAVATGVDYAATLTALRSAIGATTGAVAGAAVPAGRSIALKLVAGGVTIGVAAALWAMRPASDPAATASAVVPNTPAIEDRAPVRPQVPERRAVAPLPEPSPAPVIVPPAPVEVAPVEVAPVEVAPVESAPVESAGDKPRRPRSTDAPTDGQHDAAQAPAADDPDAYMREAKLVAKARKQLATDAGQALASTREHAREFPRGVLVEERRAIEVRALAKLGRTDEARRAAESFLGDFGDGPHAAAVRRAVAGDDDVQ